MADSTTEPVPMQAGVVEPPAQTGVPDTLRLATTDSLYRLSDGNNGNDFPVITPDGTEVTRAQADRAFAAANIIARGNPGLALKEL